MSNLQPEELQAIGVMERMSIGTLQNFVDLAEYVLEKKMEESLIFGDE